MNLSKIVLAAVAAISLAIVPTAMAADVVGPAPIYATQVVHFDGPYVGTGVITADGKAFAPVVSAGYDLRLDAFVVGGEISATVSETPVLGVDVKAGVVVTDNLAVYGLAGIEKNTKTDANFNSFGVGAELALNENVSIVASYKQVYDFGTFDNRNDKFTVGVKLPF